MDWTLVAIAIVGWVLCGWIGFMAYCADFINLFDILYVRPKKRASLAVMGILMALTGPIFLFVAVIVTRCFKHGFCLWPTEAYTRAVMKKNGYDWDEWVDNYKRWGDY